MELGRAQTPLRETGEARNQSHVQCSHCASQVDFKSTVVGVWDEGQGRERLPIHYRLRADGVISSLQPLFAHMNAT